MANRIAEEFDICQRWIATGKPPTSYYIPIAPTLALEVSDNALFSHVYDASLAPWMDANIAAIAETLGCKEEEVDGEKASWVSAGPAGARPWEIMRNTLVTIATLESNRAGKKSAPFIQKLNALFDGLTPKGARSQETNDVEELGSLSGQLLDNVHEFCEEMPREKAVNFVKQIIHYARTLRENYALPLTDRLALANSRDSFSSPSSKPAAASVSSTKRSPTKRSPRRPAKSSNP